MESLKAQVLKAKQNVFVLSHLSSQDKNLALLEIAKALREHRDEIIRENQKDLEREKDKPKAFLDRLSFDAARIESSAKGLEKIAMLADPVGKVEQMTLRPNGLQIGKKIVPLGVVGMIYEARPNVTCDAIGLCLKTGNAVVLKGGSEALNTNLAIVRIAKKALLSTKIPSDCVQLIENTTRESTKALMSMYGLIDVLIPRGGKGLIQSVVENAKVPVIETGSGNCHIYVDEFADFDMAKKIIINAKTSRVSVCNAMEKLLVHQKIAKEFLPLMIKQLREYDVEIIGDESVCAIDSKVTLAKTEDYFEEYLDYKLCIKVVENMKEAIKHINYYSSHHSEAIVTKDYTNAQNFLQYVDSAVVYVNASTRFSDGEEFGFGAEIGISTQKLHARGPMGLEALTTSKYIVFGNGQIR